MTRVSATISADASAFVREMQKANAELAKLVAAYEKVGKASKDAAESGKQQLQEQESAAGRMITSAAQWAAGLASVATAQRVITAEIRNQFEMQQKMAAAQNTVAAAEQRLAMNAANPKEFQALRGMAQRVATATGIPMQAALDAAGSANSAKGNAPLSAVEQAAMLAARAMPNNVSEIPAVASALLDARLVTGTENAAENYGKLAALQASSRPVSLGTTARYLLPAAVGAQSILPANNRYEWLASAAMMTGAAADPSGEKTSGASQVIAGKMKDFFANPGAFEQPGGGQDKGAKLLNWFIMQQASGGQAPEAGHARRFLQNNRYWRELFLGDAKFGVRAIPGAAAMFDPAREAEIQDNIASMQAATADQGDRQLGEMERTPGNRSARIARLGESAAELAKLRNPMAAQIGSIRTSLAEIEQSLGYSVLRQWHEGAPTATQGFLFGQDAQVEYLRGRVQRAQQSARSQGGDSALADQLQRLLNSLDGMTAELRHGNRAPSRVGAPEIK